ncbi:sugar transferase [Actinomyces bovis]|nr:sugar transferase [Actinomyces bovis]
MLFKRAFDVSVSVVLLLLLSWLMLLIALAIRLESSGPVFFRQVRVTQYGRQFRIFKFRTMVIFAEGSSLEITVKGDRRITKVGSFIRGKRLDELPQLFDVLLGRMSFVGPRPEVVRYVETFSGEELATLMVPAGITSSASVAFRNEDQLLEGASDVDSAYIERVLPRKMQFNLEDVRLFSIKRDCRILASTVLAVFGPRSARYEIGKTVQ